MSKWPKKDETGYYVFKASDHLPEFRPNLSPEEMFKLGSFGGTYWRPIYSDVTNRTYKNQHKEFSYFKDIPETELVEPEYDKTKNKFGVVVGTSLEYWESKGWIVEQDPYGWVQWYCRFFGGRRSDDDERQIKRWQGVAGENGRFRKRLINMIKEKGSMKKYKDDPTISPKIRQTLQHWAVRII